MYYISHTYNIALNTIRAGLCDCGARIRGRAHSDEPVRDQIPTDAARGAGDPQLVRLRVSCACAQRRSICQCSLSSKWNMILQLYLMGFLCFSNKCTRSVTNRHQMSRNCVNSHILYNTIATESKLIHSVGSILLLLEASLGDSRFIVHHSLPALYRQRA